MKVKSHTRRMGKKLIHVKSYRRRQKIRRNYGFEYSISYIRDKDKGDSRHPHHEEKDPDLEYLNGRKEYKGFEYGILRGKDAKEYGFNKPFVGRVRYGRTKIGTIPADSKQEADRLAKKIIEQKLHRIDNKAHTLRGMREEQLKSHNLWKDIGIDIVPKHRQIPLKEDPFDVLVRKGRIYRLNRPPKGHIYDIKFGLIKVKDEDEDDV